MPARPLRCLSLALLAACGGAASPKELVAAGQRALASPKLQDDLRVLLRLDG